MLAVLRCPECTAPVRTVPVAGEAATCAYCGVVLAALAPAASRSETEYSLRLRVGPSNLDRVAQVLHAHAGGDLAATRARLEQVPCEVVVGRHEEHAHEVAQAAREAGAHADVISRSVLVPLRTVTLEDAGGNRLAVITALRSDIDLTLVEAKQLVANTPSVVATAVEEAEAQALVGALERAGARARAR